MQPADWFTACLPACLPAWLPACLPDWLPACPPACLPARLTDSFTHSLNWHSRVGGRVWLAPTSAKTCDQEHRIICTLLPHIKILVRYWPKNIKFFTTNNSNYKKLVQTIKSATIITYFCRKFVWNLIFYSYNKATKFGHKQVRTVQVGNQEWDSGVVMIPTDFFFQIFL